MTAYTPIPAPSHRCESVLSSHPSAAPVASRTITKVIASVRAQRDPEGGSSGSSSASSTSRRSTSVNRCRWPVSSSARTRSSPSSEKVRLRPAACRRSSDHRTRSRCSPRPSAIASPAAEAFRVGGLDGTAADGEQAEVDESVDDVLVAKLLDRDGARKGLSGSTPSSLEPSERDASPRGARSPSPCCDRLEVADRTIQQGVEGLDRRSSLLPRRGSGRPTRSGSR